MNVKWALERVTWVDSYGSRGWSYLKDAIECHDMTIETVGWVLDERDDRITIAAHVQVNGIEDGNPSVDGIMTIPICAVTRRVVLEKSR